MNAFAHPDSHPKFSVIICAYTEKRWESLLQAVESVQNQTLPPREIILVIDHNPDLFRSASQQLKNILTVENQQEPGLSGARNTGISRAQGSFIAFMDEDAIPAPDWLEKLATPYRDPEIMGVGGAIEPIWESRKPAWFPDEFTWVVGCTYKGMPVAASPVRNLIGCNMSFRREVFETSGGFRNDMGRIGSIPAGCEETELCIRARHRFPGKTLLYQPEAKVKHRVPSIRSNWRYFQSRCYAEGISKALVANYVGSGDGLASERDYTFHTLPEGVGRGIKEAISQGKPAGLLRASAIIAGLLMTAAGYLVGSISQKIVQYRSSLRGSYRYQRTGMIEHGKHIAGE
ncbi:MAG: glycosyltransferase family 2 protein [Omnitrophica WOR_2 bacterium]